MISINVHQQSSPLGEGCEALTTSRAKNDFQSNMYNAGQRKQMDSISTLELCSETCYTAGYIEEPVYVFAVNAHIYNVLRQAYEI